MRVFLAVLIGIIGGFVLGIALSRINWGIWNASIR